MTKGKPEAVERGRWSAKAKRETVLRLLRGEDLDAIYFNLPALKAAA